MTHENFNVNIQYQILFMYISIFKFNFWKVNFGMSKYYFCYSLFQLQFLKNHGLRYIATGRSMTSDNQFWVFERDSKLDELLTEYDNMKKQLQN